jgi:hypothetical protein
VAAAAVEVWWRSAVAMRAVCGRWRHGRGEGVGFLGVATAARSSTYRSFRVGWRVDSEARVTVAPSWLWAVRWAAGGARGWRLTSETVGGNTWPTAVRITRSPSANRGIRRYFIL